MNSFLLFLLFICLLLPYCLADDANSEECTSVINFFTSYEQKTGHKLKVPTCCDNSKHVHYINCENGSITALDIRMSKLNEEIDFSDFPILPNLRKLVLEGRLFKDGILPARFFELPKLEDLEIMTSNIKYFPEKINTSCPLRKLDLYNNTLEYFPHQILEFKDLKFLDLSRNEKIYEIPDGIENLKNLEIFYIGQSGVSTMSESIFQLKKLREIDLDGNSELSTKIFKFGSALESCDFRGIDVICYEPGTCEKIIVEEEPFRKYNYEVDNVYPTCKSSHKAAFIKGTEKLGKNSNWIIIICGIIVLLIISCLILGFCYRRRSKDKDYSDDREKCINNNMSDDEEDEEENGVYIEPMSEVASYVEFNTTQLPLNATTTDAYTSRISGFNVASTTLSTSEFISDQVSTSGNISGNISESINNNSTYQYTSNLDVFNSTVNTNYLPSYVDVKSVDTNNNTFPISLITPTQSQYLNEPTDSNLNTNTNTINNYPNSNAATANTNGYQYQYSSPQQTIQSLEVNTTSTINNGSSKLPPLAINVSPITNNNNNNQPEKQIITSPTVSNTNTIKNTNSNNNNTSDTDTNKDIATTPTADNNSNSPKQFSKANDSSFNQSLTVNTNANKEISFTSVMQSLAFNDFIMDDDNYKENIKSPNENPFSPRSPLSDY